MMLYISDPNGKGAAISYKKVGDTEWKVLEETFDYKIGILDNIGNTLYVRTNKDAPKYKLFALNVETGEQTIFFQSMKKMYSKVLV